MKRFMLTCVHEEYGMCKPPRFYHTYEQAYSVMCDDFVRESNNAISKIERKYEGIYIKSLEREDGKKLLWEITDVEVN